MKRIIRTDHDFTRFLFERARVVDGEPAGPDSGTGAAGPYIFAHFIALKTKAREQER